MGRQSNTFNKETHVDNRGTMKLFCIAILLLGLSCLVESQRPTGRPGGRPAGRPSREEMCANTMEFFMDLGWAGEGWTPCPDAEELWNYMLGEWDADGNGCLSAEEFAQMWEDLELDGPVNLIFRRMDRDRDGCLELEEWMRFVRRVCRMCQRVETQAPRESEVETPAN